MRILPQKCKKGLLRPVCSSARRKPAAKVEGFASSVTTPFLERASEKFQGKALISWPWNKMFTPRKCQKFFMFTQQTLSSAKWTLMGSQLQVMKRSRLESPRPISELFGWKLEDRRVMLFSPCGKMWRQAAAPQLSPSFFILVWRAWLWIDTTGTCSYKIYILW